MKKNLLTLGLAAAFGANLFAGGTLQLNLVPERGYFVKNSPQEVVIKIDLSTVAGRHKVRRTPLNLAVSADGEHFKIFATLEDQPGEYSYPAIIQGKAGELDMTYTWNRKSIRFATVPLESVPHPH